MTSYFLLIKMADTTQTTQQPQAAQQNYVAPFPQGTTQLTQAQRVTTPIAVPDVIYRTTFSSDTVKRLTKDDFDLDSKDLITLKHDECVLVLFYVENTESMQLVNIWALAAQQIAGPVFAAVNVLSERAVAEAFTKLKSVGNHSLHWAAIKQFPFILVYRNGYPAAFYNGSREVQAIIDYALTLACEAGYYEHVQIPGSMQAEARVDMDRPGAYNPIDPGSIPIRKSSVEFVSTQPIRRFVPTTTLTEVGSQQEATETQATATQEEGAEIPTVAEVPAEVPAEGGSEQAPTEAES